MAKKAAPIYTISNDRGTITVMTKRLGVVIGINDYRPPIPRLQNAVDDAQAITALLGTYGFERDDIIELINGAATLPRLQQLFERELLDRARDVDQLLVYYAGHGHAVPDPHLGLRGFLIPADAPHGATDRFLPTEVVRRACEALVGCKHLLMIRRMHREELRECIEEPARRLFLRFGTRAVASSRRAIVSGSSASGPLLRR